MLRTQTLPVALGATWSDFAWPAKRPLDALHYRLDMAAWLADAGDTIADVAVNCSPGLVVLDEQTPDGTSVVLLLGGGVPSSVATVWLLVTLTTQDVLTLAVSLPIMAGEPAGLVQVWPVVLAPPGSLLVGADLLTFAGMLIDFGPPGPA